ncbi:lytic transglycosylase domain-containing protein [Erythrobacter colymbi]|uniref:lytic transglycosylase domain-containing protein n=1 Tax=Erythrobacter colymbi TaxID=1161202 RepID=UPI000A36CEAC|nr:lytic transglycosylase domain-containing protein [Erythrobacter colymbi]
MILSAACRLVIVAAALAGPVGARADVLEVGPEGAHWVAGPLAGQPVGQSPAAPTAAAPAAVPVLDAQWGEAPPVPEYAVADPARHAQAIPPRYAAKIAELSVRYDLSPALIEAVVWQESRWNENAVSPVGAQGLAQLMPGTARYLGVDPSDPFANLEGGARYLREQLDRFGGDLEKALAAYNAGPGRVERSGGIPNIRETREYVAAIIGRLSNYSRVDGR